MTGANTYGGPTVINAGTVQLGNEIVGFGANTSGSASQTNSTWQFNNTANTATAVSGGTLNLTSNVGGEARSGFYTIPVPMGAFNASFVYQASGNKAADGVAFILQNDPRGPAALGGTGGSLGYSGITPSAATEINIYTTNTIGTAFATNGATGVYQSITPVNPASGDPIQVSLSYDGSTYLTTTFLDLSSGSSYSAGSQYVGSLASNVGSSAYVGFSGGDGGSKSTQTISNFVFSYNAGAFNNILPSTTALSIAAGATLDLSGNSQTVGSLSGAGTVTNYSANALSVLTAGDNSSQTFSGVLSDGYGTLGLIKVGSGGLTLTGTSVYSGGTTVSGGTLKLGNGTTKNGSLAGGIVNNSALVIANPATQLYGGLISGGGSLTKNGAGTLQLTATHTYTGPTVINAGTVQLGYVAAMSGFGANTSGGIGFGKFSSTGSATNGLATTGTGNGTWSFNSYSYNYGFNRTPVTGGSLDLTDGSLTTSAAGTNGSGEARSAFYNTPVSLNNSFIASFTYTPSYPGGTAYAATSNYNNGFAFVVAGSGGTSLGGAGRGFGVGYDPEQGGTIGKYGGQITASAEIDYDVFQGHGVNGLVYSPSGAATGYNTNGGTVTNMSIFGGNSYTIGDPINMTVIYNPLTNVLIWSGTDSGAAHSGTNALTFSESQANVNLQSITGGTSGFIGFTGANGYNDSTQTVSNFSFSSAVNGNLPSTTALFISNSGALDLFGAGQTVGDLSGAGTVTNSFPMVTAMLATGVDGTTQTFSGRLKDGAGALALTVSGGILTLSGSNNTYSAGTYVEYGTLIAANPAAIEDGTSLTVGNSAAFFGPLTPASAGVSGAGSPADAAERSVAAVPEPGAAALAATGTILLALYGERRRRKFARSARKSKRRI
jgi:autotransporter-associated beta strand protein